MKYFCATYSDFIKFDRKPNEDCFLISKTLPVFAVADGVTQSHFLSGEYAYPMGAKAAAEIFCDTAVKSLENNYQEKDKKNIIKNAFDLINEKIKQLNISEGIAKKMNYIEYDLFDTVGAAGFLNGNKLYFGYAGDCGLAIFSKSNKKKFQTKDMVAPAVKRFRSLYKDWENMPLPEKTLIMHRDFRNNPNKKGYGSFSGEDGAEKYYKFGNKKLNKGDIVVFYSDGFLELLKNKEFIEILRKQNKNILDEFIIKKAKENPKKYGDDRTFVSFIF